MNALSQSADFIRGNVDSADDPEPYYKLARALDSLWKKAARDQVNRDWKRKAQQGNK